jgi:rhamnulokinase
LGIELEEPRITPEARERNFTNEGGVAGTTRFLKNINGLWLIQECRRIWARQGEDLGYAEITRQAAEATSSSYILPGASEFFAPDDMPAEIQEFCRRTSQPVPTTKGEIARCALESLALTYREVVESTTHASGHRIERLHIVGGGIRNSLLNQLAANALGIPVFTGPVEATTMGNVLVQAMATGALRDVGEIRAVVRSSVEPAEYSPRDREAWNEKYKAFIALRDRVRA